MNLFRISYDAMGKHWQLIEWPIYFFKGNAAYTFQITRSEAMFDIGPLNF